MAVRRKVDDAFNAIHHCAQSVEIRDIAFVAINAWDRFGDTQVKDAYVVTAFSQPLCGRASDLAHPAGDEDFHINTLSNNTQNDLIDIPINAS
jgi:hypothetical protein